MRPEQALSDAAAILIKHFTPVAEFCATAVREEKAELPITPGLYYDVPIEDLDLTMRAYNCLKRAGITRVGELIERLERGKDELLAIRNFGQKSLVELVEKLREKGYLPADYQLS
jgi:DNA-directed RNA polymerase subunit alpha